MKLHGKNIIGNSLALGALNGKATRAISPLTNSHIDEPFFHQADPAEVDAAMLLAEAAFNDYRSTSGIQRAEFLERIAAEIVAIGDPLIDRAHAETGLPKDRLIGERGRTVGQLKMFAELLREGSWVDARIDTAIPDRKPVPKPDLRRMLIPLGPVVVFGSSNFPLAFSVAGGDTASALAAGCPVVVKAHSAHPGTSEYVATAIRIAADACKLHPGVFSMLHGSGRVIGTALVKHPFTRAVGFTGSREGGRALFDAAASRPDPIPVFAEMSSLNPVFILPAALQERGAAISEGLKNSFTMGVGQFCTKPGLVFVIDSPTLNEFIDTFAQKVGAAAPGTMLHPGICESFQQGLNDVAKVPGVTLLAKSTQPGATANQGSPIALQTSAENFLRQPLLTHEVFGPYTLLVTAQSSDELEAVAAALEGQLTATIHGTEADLVAAGSLVQILERKAGRLVFNAFPTGVEVCPSMQHGGPYPATTDARFTSVGTAAIQRFVRPVSYQGFPQANLPDELKDGNPRRIHRIVNGKAESPLA